MPGLLMTGRLARQCDRDLRAIAARTGVPITPLILPDDDAPLPAAVLAQVELAYASPDLYDVGVRRVWRFLDTLDGAPNLRWAHLGWAGTDNPRFGAMLARGVRLSNSPGAAAEPIAHSVMAGLLALARRLPYFAAQQREHRWERLPLDRRPPDLSTQTLVVYGLGAIGGEVARLARAFGLHVIGVRRSPRTAQDTVDELVHPRDLDGVLPRADWLVVSAPRTPQTEGAISAARLALLPPHAHLIQHRAGQDRRRAGADRRPAVGCAGGRIPRRGRAGAAGPGVAAVGSAERDPDAAQLMGGAGQPRARAPDLPRQPRVLAARRAAAPGDPRAMSPPSGCAPVPSAGGGPTRANDSGRVPGQP